MELKGSHSKKRKRDILNIEKCSHLLFAKCKPNMRGVVEENF
jgi:hypothetical protein